jgi:hypothetical protein
VTRHERIAFLLEHFHDVLAGLRDKGDGGEHIPLMCLSRGASASLTWTRAATGSWVNLSRIDVDPDR